MTPSTYKILARFDHDRRKAIQYCNTLALTYPRLQAEYEAHAETIRQHQTEGE